jgi:hypothetical protein
MFLLQLLAPVQEPLPIEPTLSLQRFGIPVVAVHEPLPMVPRFLAHAVFPKQEPFPIVPDILFEAQAF